MAVLKLSTKMAFWKMKVDGKDMTSLFRDFVESITIKKSTLPPPKNSKKEHSPNEATISIISKNYLEDLFVEGTEIKIYMGYDRLLTEKSLVFHGTVPVLPDGEASEMLKYNVKAMSKDIVDLAKEEKSRAFLGLTKAEIINTILYPYNYDVTVDIDDTTKPMTSYPPLQIKKTDLELLELFAKSWGCRMWFEYPNKVYFVDPEKVSIYKPLYYLGYRTDKMQTDIHYVENVSWKHEPDNKGTAGTAGGFSAFTQDGEIETLENYKIYSEGKTWRIKPEVLARIKASPDKLAAVGDVLADIAEKTFTWNAYVARDKYYEIVNPDDNTKRFLSDDNSGMEVKVKLNEGDPDLAPPKRALLYHGSINPKADTSHLPNFLSRYGMGQIWLNVNETVLSYKQGKLDSELSCTIGKTEA
jgi:hypothetical protein